VRDVAVRFGAPVLVGEVLNLIGGRRRDIRRCMVRLLVLVRVAWDADGAVRTAANMLVAVLGSVLIV